MKVSKYQLGSLLMRLRSDALDIKVFYKKCTTVVSCKITEQDGNLKTELLKNILKQAAIYEKHEAKIKTSNHIHGFIK